MISQCLFTKAGRSCKAAAGRVVSLLAVTANRVVRRRKGVPHQIGSLVKMTIILFRQNGSWHLFALHKLSCIAPLPARLAGSRGW